MSRTLLALAWCLLVVGCSKLDAPLPFEAGDGFDGTVDGRSSSIDPPTATIVATPETIQAGQEVTLTLSSEHGDVGFVAPLGALMLEGTVTDTPQQTTTYIFLVDGEGGTAIDVVVVEVMPPDAPEATIETANDTIQAGETTRLTVTSTNADEGLITPIAVTLTDGYVDVTPAYTTTYFFSVVGPGGTDFDAATVVVLGATEACEPRPTAAITASPTTIDRGQEVTLTVASTDADHGLVVPTATSILNGAFADTPEYTTTYLFVADGPCGSAHDAVTVEVLQPAAPPRPTATITATPMKINKAGAEVVLTLTSTDADDGLLVPPGTSILNGEVVVTPHKTTTYLFAVDGPGGSAHAAVTVEVGCGC